MDNNDKNSSFIASLSEIKDESSMQDTPSTAEKNHNHDSVQIPHSENYEGESNLQLQDYKDESYHYPDQGSNLNDSLLQNNADNHSVVNGDQNSQINYQSSLIEQTPDGKSIDPSQGLISKPTPSITERISEIHNASQNMGTLNSVMSSNLNEEATLNFEYDDDNTNTGEINENEEEEISITPNVEMQSIFKNLATIQMDEDRDTDEYSEFLNECLYKHIKKMPLTLNDRKKIVEINFHDPKKYSIHRLAKLTGVQRKTIRIWKMTYNEICEQQDLSITRIKKAGRNYSFSDKEMELINFIDKLREEKVAVTSNMIIAKMLQLKPELKDKSMGALQRMCYRILQKNNYSLRRASHLGQPLPCKSMDLFYDFFRDIIRKRQELGIYDTEADLSRIVNIDETPIFFEMTTDKTYNKKGAKVVSIETKGNEKKLISTVLAVSANGKKLTPTLIFKGGKDGNLEGRYKNLQCVKDRKIAIYFQSNAWCDEGIFKKWVKDVYLHYEEKEIQKKCILIMDKAPSHIYRAKFLDKKKKSYVFIPGGLTRYLQPLDIGINRQFKDHLKNLYLANLADNIMDDNETAEKEMELLKKYDNVFGDGKRPSTLDAQRLNIINWVIDVWWNDEKIKTSAIINSFNKAAISYPLDGSKDTDFVFPEEVMNQKQ
jgi:DNA-binding transcriptional MerR regulator